MPSIWTIPATKANQDPTLVGDWNTYVRDNLLYLYDAIANNSGIPITSTTVAGAASYTFSSIPTTYKHLMIRGYSLYTVTASCNLAMQFNADTAGNYYWGQWGRNAGGGLAINASAAATTSLTALGLVTTAAWSANFEILFYDYASTTYRKGYSGFSNRGDAIELINNGGLWTGTAAINAIKLFTSTGNNFWGELALYGFNG